MKKIVLPFVAVFVCVASATAIRAISATTNSSIAGFLPVNINTSSLVQTGDRAGVPRQARTLIFTERVRYQRAIEEVYWRHRIWPKERHDAKRSLDAVMTQAQLEKKVTDYVRNSQALEDYWHRPITAEQLQAEMNRMAQHTKQPEVLRELFEALGNDPFVIAECLARPVLAERLLTNSYAYDQRIHGELKQGAEADLQTRNSIEQMKQLSGKYSKIEFVKSEKQKDRLTLARVAWQKQPLGSWPATVRDQAPAMIAAASAKYTLPNVSGGATCTDDTWTATSITNAPTARFGRHTAVWTGSEMIVWGGNDGNNTNTGGKYNPSTDSWTATSTANAPAGRSDHTAVWTGSEMIVWGGSSLSGDLNTGGRYNPSTDSWTAATSTTNAPTARGGHTAVWTGSEMIVWGGSIGGFETNTGGRYNPSTNSWAATSTTNAPSARLYYTAVWTGSEMIVWGGTDFASWLITGGRYDPSTDSWTSTSTLNAPEGRDFHTAVWIGSEMIVWGGFNGLNYLNTGGRYNPATDSWVATSNASAPSGRVFHTAVWTGTQMIVWGGWPGGEPGFHGFLNTGGKYNPVTNSWTATHVGGGPSPRGQHRAVWTGNEMIIWGGEYGVFASPLDTGGKYCAPLAGSQLGNISTRAFVQTGDKVMIGGFIVQGLQTKRVIIRAIGPELTQHGVPDAMSNPTLELHDATGALIASNDDWQHTIIGGIITSDQRVEILASGHAPKDGRESAIIADLPPGNYTAIVRGVNDTTGVALAEVYDLSPQTNSTLGNISTRSFVQTGDNVMIGGFIVQGTEPKEVILRAIGPELIQHGVPDALANPTLELHDETGALIASNDNWVQTIIGGIITTNQVRDIRNSGLAPADRNESAVIVTLPPGNYTAIVRGVNNTTGVGLVEVYDLD